MKRSDNIGWSQLKAGIFIIFALLFFAGGILLMGEKTKFFIPKGKLSVIMSDVAGLKVGAPVWLAGVDVGIVTDIQFEKPNKTNEVEIVLQVEKSALKKIGKDSAITVKTRGLMGEKYVDVTPSLYITQVPETRLYGTSITKLDDVMQKAGKAFDKFNHSLDKMNRGEGSLGRLATDTKLYDNLVSLTAELDSFAKTANSGQGTLGKLNKSREPYDRLMAILNRTDATMKDIQSSEGTLSKLLHDRELYDKMVALADQSKEAAEDVRELKQRLTSPDGTFGKLLQDREFYDKGMALLERADTSVKAFEDVAIRINSGEGTAGKLVNDQALYDKMNKIIDDMNLLVKDLKENPKRYLKFSVF